MSALVPSTLEVDFETNITDLYRAITASDWDEAIRAVKKNPDEAKTWVVRKSAEDPETIMWRFLPIHSACARKPPSALITALIAAYPEGARCDDDQNMYALHYAAGNQASREVIRSLLMAFPNATKFKDPRGMLPIHYIACWGPSSISVVDMVLVANRNIADSKDEDGNTPMDLAKDSDYPEKDAVVAALRRWSNNSSSESGQQQSTPSDLNTLSSYVSEHSNTPSYKVIGSNFKQIHVKEEEQKINTSSYKVIGSKFQSLSVSEEKKTDDSFDGANSSCISPGTVQKIHDMDDHMSVMDIEAKEDKLEISMLQYELKQRNEMIEHMKHSLILTNDECTGLRRTLADVTESHEGLVGMNSSLFAMVEQQEIVLKATRAREEQWEKLASMRRQRLRDLVQMEEEDTFQEVDLRNTLAKQAHEMAAIKATMTTTFATGDNNIHDA